MIWAISVIAFTGVVSLCGALQPQIPSVDIYEVSHAPPFVFTAKTRIVVDEASANVGSPSLLDFATTFRADLQDVFALSAPPPLMTHALKNTSFTYPTIILTTGATNFTYFSGRPTGEGYEIDILQKSVVIRGVDVIGTWWGTRTLLQQLVLAKNKKTLGAGRMRDSPGWPVRGFMLDAGRHWFEPQFIGEPSLLSMRRSY
jgi:hexosaminidase